MSTNWTDAVDERIAGHCEAPLAKEARDMGLTIDQYRRYLDDIDEARQLAEWRATHPDRDGCGKAILFWAIIVFATIFGG